MDRADTNWSPKDFFFWGAGDGPALSADDSCVLMVWTGTIFGLMDGSLSPAEAVFALTAALPAACSFSAASFAFAALFLTIPLISDTMSAAARLCP